MKIAYNPITAEALTTAPANNDITFDLRGLNIFVRGVKFKGTDTTYSVFKKHTSSSGGGYNGLVPVPSYTSTNVRFLREDGTWQVPSNQYTYSSLTNQDLDTLKTEGKWYYLGGGNTVTNGPSDISKGGELYVGRNASGYRYLKVILLDGVIWFRIWNSSSWSDWKRWYTDANTDSKVLQSNTTTANYRPIILGYNNNADYNNISTSVTLLVYTTTSIYAQPSTGSLWATKLYSGGKPVLTDHLSLSNYVTLNTTLTITGLKTFTSQINSSLNTTTYLEGNKGKAIINSTAGAGQYVMLFKGNSTNGYFTHGVYLGKYLLQYTAKSTVDAGTNAVTKSVTLLDESGNSLFPGNVTAPKFIGSLLGNADSATKLTTSAGSSSLPVYFADGKPVACTPSSLFSNLSNSGNDISITIAGQNRTLTVNYAGKAKLLYSYALPTTSYNKVGWYCKIASISMTSLYSSKAALLCITDEYTTNSNSPRYGFIYVKVLQLDALGSSPNVTLRISGSLTTSLVTGILTLSSSSSKLDIYLKEDLSYQSGYISFIHGKEDIRTNSQELVQTLPSGTVINSQYGDISNLAVSLLNSRKINGTSFNGTTDITTANWGTTRNLTIGNSTKAVNGSGNVSWTLSEIGAASTSHTHSYLPLSGGTMNTDAKITWDAKGTNFITDGDNDAANGYKGALNNLVISSWYGVSFTTSCTGLTCTNTNAVSINCRNGYLYAGKLFSNGTEVSVSGHNHDSTYVNITGDTMTGLLTVTSGGSHKGIKVGSCYLNAIDLNLIFLNINSIRFGADNWAYNDWGGLTYKSKTIYLGAADGTIFAQNAGSITDAVIKTPGVNKMYIGNNTTNLVWHAGNDGSGSGLDADLLDGFHLSSIVHSELGYSTATTEANGTSSNLSRSGFWRDNSRYKIGVFACHSTDTRYGWELACSYFNATPTFRIKNDGTWGLEKLFAFTDDLEPLKNGSKTQPIVLFSGPLYRSGSVWYVDLNRSILAANSGPSSLTKVTIENARMKIELSSVNAHITSASIHVTNTSKFSGDSLENLSGGSEGPFWFSVFANIANYVYIRPFCQGNANNDSWLSLNNAWTSYISRITVTLFGYID